MELLKLLSTNEIVVQILSFLTLFFLLRVFFWKRILKLLDDRKEKISSELKNIENEKSAVEKIRLEYEEKLKSIEEAARLKLQEAIENGETITQEIKKNAQQEAEKIIEAAKNDIRYELVKAKEGLKEEIIDTVIKATENLLEEKITEGKDKQIVAEFLKGLDKVK